jgi:hypothetical protein
VHLRRCRPVVVIDCHPGLVWTELLQAKLLKEGPLLSLRRRLVPMAARVVFRTPRQGAAVVLEAALRNDEDDEDKDDDQSIAGSTKDRETVGVCDEEQERQDEENRSYMLPTGRTETPQGIVAEGSRRAAARATTQQKSFGSRVRGPSLQQAGTAIDEAALLLWNQLVQHTGVDWGGEAPPPSS